MTIDTGEPFVKATYHLEGDSPLIFSAYKEIKALEAGIHSQYYPNTNAVANKLSPDPTRKQQLIEYGKACVKPAYEYHSCQTVLVIDRPAVWRTILKRQLCCSITLNELLIFLSHTLYCPLIL